MSNEKSTCLCRKNTQVSRNKLCTSKLILGYSSCGILYRNGHNEKFILDNNSIVIAIPEKEDTFVHPLWNATNAIKIDIDVWLVEKTLVDWNQLFVLTEIANSDIEYKPTNFKELKEFSEK